ncbi:NACHT domain-containing protein [Vibrio splendidus]|uniref:NACHT domain-containing protein n=1 Tax=Vibrio splendidus TaxID=29497 RepID=UPI001E5B2031|nr:NACHT domain-containing protein [Vibrio splendidus]MCC4862709.1 NACHT domain-containing protein [Vibrio splendidus]
MLEQMLGAAVTGGLSTLASKIIKSSGGAISKKLEQTLSERNLKTFRGRSERVGYVKTILNPDSIEPLDRIFFENATLCDGDKIETFTQFSRKHVLVEGGPGQGKSLLLRRACINESESSSYIPIFIEFRNLAYSKSLKIEIIEAINELGVPIETSVFDYIAKKGNVILFLDGFDEIPNDKKK